MRSPGRQWEGICAGARGSVLTRKQVSRQPGQCATTQAGRHVPPICISVDLTLYDSKQGSLACYSLRETRMSVRTFRDHHTLGR
jgi:hypothetical protein